MLLTPYSLITRRCAIFSNNLSRSAAEAGPARGRPRRWRTKPSLSLGPKHRQAKCMADRSPGAALGAWKNLLQSVQGLSCRPSELLQEFDYGQLVGLAKPAPAPDDLTCVTAILLCTGTIRRRADIGGPVM